MRTIESITQLIRAIDDDLSKWGREIKPWFRGESGDQPPLCPKIANFSANEENYLLHSFRRQAGALANSPPREGHTDMWLFKAQHYGVPTRLLDWTEGALLALYFAINRGNQNPRMYMLNPHHINELASGQELDDYEYPLSWVELGRLYVALAWEHRDLAKHDINPGQVAQWDLDIPLAFPATYQDQRMIAQRSCFTIHGTALKPFADIFQSKGIDFAPCLVEYEIDFKCREELLRELSILGISAATIFPDLDHLSQDLISDISRKK